jgi:Luciferase-like monooxygenase
LRNTQVAARGKLDMIFFADGAGIRQGDTPRGTLCRTGSDMVQAGASDQGRELGAATAEVIYVLQDSLQQAQGYYADVKGRMATYGREPDDLKIMPAICPIVSRTRAEAQAEFDELQTMIDPLVGLGGLYSSFGDLSGYPLDGPVPENALGKKELRSLSVQLVERVRKEKPTIRELYLRSGITGSAKIGSPADIAHAMQDWFEGAACDGFNVTPATLPGGGEDFVEMVVHELQHRGLFRIKYEGRTLREDLGLSDRPLQPAQPGLRMTPVPGVCYAVTQPNLSPGGGETPTARTSWQTSWRLEYRTTHR